LWSPHHYSTELGIANNESWQASAQVRLFRPSHCVSGKNLQWCITCWREFAANRGAIKSQLHWAAITEWLSSFRVTRWRTPCSAANCCSHFCVSLPILSEL
jgi:hypothetical protein